MFVNTLFSFVFKDSNAYTSKLNKCCVCIFLLWLLISKILFIVQYFAVIMPVEAWLKYYEVKFNK